MSPPVPEPAEGKTPVPESAEGTSRGTRHFEERNDRSGLPLVLLAVFAAGVVGTAARLGLDAVVPTGPGGMPVSTLLINTLGSFLLGCMVATIPHHSPEWLRAGVTTGLLGSFTTFSALTVATVQLTGSGGLLPAAALLILSVGAGVGAAVVGMTIGVTMRKRRA